MWWRMNFFRPYKMYPRSYGLFKAENSAICFMLKKLNTAILQKKKNQFKLIKRVHKVCVANERKSTDLVPIWYFSFSNWKRISHSFQKCDFSFFNVHTLLPLINCMRFVSIARLIFNFSVDVRKSKTGRSFRKEAHYFSWNI